MKTINLVNNSDPLPTNKSEDSQLAEKDSQISDGKEVMDN